MFIIKVKNKDEYIRNGTGYIFTEILNEARTFIKTGRAVNSMRALPNFVQRVGLEIVEVEIKIK